MDYYDETAEGYDELHKEEQEKKLKIICEHLKVQKDEKLLDVGCGTGFACRWFRCEYVGIDPASDMIKAAKKRGCCRFLVGKAEELPFADASFDIVISVTAIHNFDDVMKGLSEMRRVGKSRYAFSVLKKSKKLGMIRRAINELFEVTKEVEEAKDIIFFCSKHPDKP